ncbi:MAG: succinylglutamate desuccinylase [Gemmatimonadales bacterium]|nr:succinylglutamate desuccinylase [Gemmatimonadales bacterium]MDG2239079.1 M14 family metallopeptidase [Longimicrobiales bacterium]MBT3957952.1 succinylglutamate desuccinylase [Gemmatimonadales bacterium]MBT4437046.1 succinylglutamate desuccinylase [Gemmatimonadales bacterium]MBT4914746.1 succinylglutamate desuccinylase [Gemmatimonadales bacterium]
MTSTRTVTVGTASAAPGTAVRGAIPVTELAGGTPLEIPVVVANGANEGPCFWVNGAIHGDEPEGPLACQIALAEVDPAQLSGTLVLCPVLNVPAFEAAQRGNPADTFAYDMNRIYPGNPAGYLSERVAAAHAAAMGPVADLEISIHSGGSHSFLDKAIFVDERPESVELATAMGVGWGCIMSSFNPSGSPMAYMKELGKVGITVELGGRSATSPSAFARVGRELADSILNILRHYEMYPGEALYPSPRYRGQQEALLAPASGIFIPEPGVEFLTMMAKGDPIARIVNVFGDTLAQLEAPADGMFFGLRALPNVTTGDWCCFFCKVEGTRD